MRICLVTSSYPRFGEDGNARFVRSIAEAQVALGHEVHVVAPYAPGVQPYASSVHLHWFRYVWPARLGVMGHARALENDRVLGRAVLWQTPWFSLSLAWATLRVVRIHRIELVHAHWVIPSGFLAGQVARVMGKPFFVSLHGSDMYLARRNRRLGQMATWTFRQAQGITACSQPLADAALQMGALPERTQVIPYGADIEKFGPPDDAPEELRRRFHLLPDDRVILAAGRLVGKKGFVHLVRAMPSVLARVPQARLVILGEGPERAALEHARDALRLNERVLLPGTVLWKEMPSYLAVCEIFAMPSIIDASGNLDGLPNVILEAMAAGRPVVATRIAGIPLVVRDGETGVLVDEASPGQLSAALLQVMASRETGLTMGQAARTRIKVELNWSELAKRLDLAYQANNPRRPRVLWRHDAAR